MKLYKFYEDCGRMGDLSSVFLAEPEAVESLMGQEIYFGEVLGKHSEVICEIDENSIEMMSDDPVLVQKLSELFPTGTLSGHNPLNYIEEYEDDEDEDE